ncbi:MAG: TetR/AcrR family transcriptional regulator [Brevundimonas sp.]
MTHINLIHHFGSAAGLQSALMGFMVGDLTRALDAAIARLRTDDGAPLELVNAVFDAFDEGGAGKLAAWIVPSDELSQMEPVRAAVRDLVGAVREKLDMEERMGSAVLFLALVAFGEALIGSPLRDMLDQDRDAGLQVSVNLLLQFMKMR